MVQEYYAMMSRLTQETDGKMRTGIEFEVVALKKLDFFLGKETASSIDTYEKHGDILRAYRDYGVMDERFRRRKVNYLGETGFAYVTVYFDDLKYTRYQYENWYLLSLSDKEGELSGIVYGAAWNEWGDTGDPVINYYAKLESMPTSQARLLRQLYYPYIPKESRAENGTASNTVNMIQHNTLISQIRFLYVGAALNVALYDHNKKEIAFFDLGTMVSQNPCIAAQQPMAALSRETLIEELQNISATNPMTIFISHWHRDHCNALGAFTDENDQFTGTEISNHTEWFVPEDTRIPFQIMQNAIPAQNFHVYSRRQEYQPLNVNGNGNIQVGKINLQNNLHPHHQGLYVQLLTEDCDGYILLVGDTTYEGLPNTIIGRKYDVLQVCHHGGDYHLPPAKQNRAEAQRYIPRALDNMGSAVYSADGIYHGHPNLSTIVDHRNAGYVEREEEQLQNMALSGQHILYYD